MNETDDLFRIGYFELAKNTSKYSDCRVKMGAVIANHKPIGIGFNKRKTHTRFCNPSRTKSVSIHCEISAILNTGKEFVKGSTIYIYREDVHGKPKLAKPCDNCMRELKRFGVKRIYYTVNDYPFFNIERI